MYWINKLASICDRCGEESHCMYLTIKYEWLCGECKDKERECDAKVQRLCGQKIHGSDGET